MVHGYVGDKSARMLQGGDRFELRNEVVVVVNNNGVGDPPFEQRLWITVESPSVGRIAHEFIGPDQLIALLTADPVRPVMEDTADEDAFAWFEQYDSSEEIEPIVETEEPEWFADLIEE